MKLPLILPVPLLAPAFVSIFAPKTTPPRVAPPPPEAQPADLDRIGYDTIKNAPPEAGKEARQANLAALFGGDLSAPAPTAEPGAPTTRVLTLWAGAKRSEWDAGVGEVLREAARTFTPATPAGSPDAGPASP